MEMLLTLPDDTVTKWLQAEEYMEEWQRAQYEKQNG